MLRVSSRPSALHAERNRCTRNRPGASAASKGVMPPSEKLPSISSVTGAADPLWNTVAISSARSPANHDARCSSRQPAAFASVVIIVVRAPSEIVSCSASRNPSIVGEFRSVCPCANAPGYGSPTSFACTSGSMTNAGGLPAPGIAAM